MRFQNAIWLLRFFSVKVKCVYVCLFKRDSLQRHTAATGFAGISTDEAFPLS